MSKPSKDTSSVNWELLTLKKKEKKCAFVISSSCPFNENHHADETVQAENRKQSPYSHKLEISQANCTTSAVNYGAALVAWNRTQGR